MIKITVKEFALLAADVYISHSAYAKKTSDDSPNISTWRLITDDKLLHVSYHSSFFARLYVRFQGTRATGAVVAYRGTMLTSLGNLVNDVELALHIRPDSLPLAKAFYNKAFAYLMVNHPGLLPKLTGHSLGGALAQLVAIERSEHYHPQTVVFNSPGVGCLLDANERNQDHSYIHQINTTLDNIHDIGSRIGDEEDLRIETAGCQKFYSASEIAEHMNGSLRGMMANAAAGNLTSTISSIGIKDVAECAITQHTMANMLVAIKDDPSLASQGF
jgi:hypothetical protein